MSYAIGLITHVGIHITCTVTVECVYTEDKLKMKNIHFDWTDKCENIHLFFSIFFFFFVPIKFWVHSTTNTHLSSFICN